MLSLWGFGKNEIIIIDENNNILDYYAFKRVFNELGDTKYATYESEFGF